MPVNKWTPKKHKKKKLHIGLMFPILLTLVIPVLSVLFFPKGSGSEMGVCIMLLYAFIAGIALGTDQGIWLWLLCVFEAALWPVLVISLPSVEGNFVKENITWLAGSMLYTFCFCLVLSGIIGLGLRQVFKTFSSDD